MKKFFLLFFFSFQIGRQTECLEFQCDPVFKTCFALTEQLLNFTEAVDYCKNEQFSNISIYLVSFRHHYLSGAERISTFFRPLYYFLFFSFFLFPFLLIIFLLFFSSFLFFLFFFLLLLLLFLLFLFFYFFSFFFFPFFSFSSFLLFVFSYFPLLLLL